MLVNYDVIGLTMDKKLFTGFVNLKIRFVGRGNILFVDMRRELLASTINHAECKYH